MENPHGLQRGMAADRKKIVPELREEKTRHFRHKCPLCGGGLYYVHAKGKSDLIRCTSCGLFYTVKKERGKRDE